MMGPLLVLLFIVMLSLIAVRVGALALTMTGLSYDTANFQSYSAFFGVGFTTAEAEMVVNHPIRRRIIRDLILVGNLGLTSAMATVIVTFLQANDTVHTLLLLGVLILGGIAFGLIVKSGPLRKLLDSAIRFTLKRAGLVRALDYELLLRARHGFCVSEVEILKDSPYVNQTLRQSRPSDDGLVILGIQKKDGDYLGAPGPEDRIEVGDVIMIYGAESAVRNLC